MEQKMARLLVLSSYGINTLFKGRGLMSVLRIRWYMFLGVTLVCIYLFQQFAGVQWVRLEILQQGNFYKQFSGYVLFGLILYQWRLSKARNLNKQSGSVGVLKSHKWVGAILPLPLFLHATEPGYAYLEIMSYCMLFSIVVGLFNVETVRIRCQVCLFTWTLLHIIAATLCLVLAMFHIYVVYAYS